MASPLHAHSGRVWHSASSHKNALGGKRYGGALAVVGDEFDLAVLDLSDGFVGHTVSDIDLCLG